MFYNGARQRGTAERMLVCQDNISGIDFLFSRRDAITLLEIIHATLSCDAADDFVSLFMKIQNLFSFDFAISTLTTLGSDGSIRLDDITNINYPSEWEKIYAERQFQSVDVIIKENFTTRRPQFWSETYEKNPPPKDFVSIAEDFGLKEGYTYGLKTSGQKKRASVFSFSGNFYKYDKRIASVLELLVPHLHQALCHIHTSKSPYCDKNLLSGREKDVLSWLAYGKSSWEISVILNISERTVNFHVYNIMQKLDAVNRPHAVAVAASLGLIEFD